jgi:hypothetical protein
LQGAGRENIMIDESKHPSQAQSEGRVTRRYSIAARVSFQWRGSDKTWYPGVGVTQDISAAGALILAQEIPPLGAEVEIMVMLPSVSQGVVAKGRLSGTGTVVRVTTSSGFAAAVNFHLLNAGNSATSESF